MMMMMMMVMVMVVLTAVFAVAVDGRLDVNVALNRPSFQISTWTDHLSRPHSASYANDGNHDTDILIRPCVHTLSATNPFWSVDLLVPLHVASVKFTNRYGDGMSAANIWLFWSVYSSRITASVF